MKILITGGAGYLGSVFTRNLLKNHEVIVYDNLMYNQTSLVDLSNNPNFTFHYGDVREWSKLKYLVEQVDIVIPLAALVSSTVKFVAVVAPKVDLSDARASQVDKSLADPSSLTVTDKAKSEP